MSEHQKLLCSLIWTYHIWFPPTKLIDSVIGGGLAEFSEAILISEVHILFLGLARFQALCLAAMALV